MQLPGTILQEYLRRIVYIQLHAVSFPLQATLSLVELLSRPVISCVHLGMTHSNANRVSDLDIHS